MIKNIYYYLHMINEKEIARRKENKITPRRGDYWRTSGIKVFWGEFGDWRI